VALFLSVFAPVEDPDACRMRWRADQQTNERSDAVDQPRGRKSDLPRRAAVDSASCFPGRHPAFSFGGPERPRQRRSSVDVWGQPTRKKLLVTSSRCVRRALQKRNPGASLNWRMFCTAGYKRVILQGEQTTIAR